VGVAFLAAMWKWYYYAPNTYKQLKIAQMRKDGITVSEEDAHAPYTLPVALLDTKEGAKYKTGPIDFLRRCMGPYLLIRFFLLPAPLLLIKALLGTSLPLYATAVANLALADAVSNIHSFIIIATNHCGDDMYKFDRSVTPRSGSFYMRAITSSSNFRTSNGIDPKTGLARRVHGNMADLNDFMHGWLNYQIEHHAWPQLSMLSYQKSAPRCARSAPSITCPTCSTASSGVSRRPRTSWWATRTCALSTARGSMRRTSSPGTTRRWPRPPRRLTRVTPWPQRPSEADDEQAEALEA
jgi:hypothetical protein